MISLENLHSYSSRTSVAEACARYLLSKGCDLSQAAHTLLDTRCSECAEIFGLGVDRQGDIGKSIFGPDFDSAFPTLSQRLCVAVMTCRIAQSDSDAEDGPELTRTEDTIYNPQNRGLDRLGPFACDRSLMCILRAMHVVENYSGLFINIPEELVSEFPGALDSEKEFKTGEPLTSDKGKDYLESSYMNYVRSIFSKVSILDINDPANWNVFAITYSNGSQ